MQQKYWLSVLSRSAYIVSLLFGSAAYAQFLSSTQTSPLLRSAQRLGPEDVNKSVRLQFWLNVRNEAALTQLTDEVNDPDSASYRHWLSTADFRAKFAPTDAQIAKVKTYLTRQGFKVDAAQTSQMYVSASASVDKIQRALHVSLEKFSVRGRVIMANTSDPILDSEIRPLVSLIGGLSNQVATSKLIHGVDPVTGEKSAPKPLTHATPNQPPHYDCFRTPVTHTFTTADGKTQAVYSGLQYGPDRSGAPTTTKECSFDPITLRKVYGVDKLIEKKLDGRGQTIVIIDAFGSPTIQNDAATYDRVNNVAAIDLKILQPHGVPIASLWNANQQGWAEETTLDVEIAHAMAPGAKIALVEALSDSDHDLLSAMTYAVENHLGNIISNSWGDYETLVDQKSAAQYEVVLKAAAVQGISVHFASGDSGNLVGVLGYEDVGFPTSAYMTSVGGTTLAVNDDNTRRFEIAWGNNYVTITGGTDTYADSMKAMNPPLTTPLANGFIYGSTGGPSRWYPKPKYQKKIAGPTRQQPDISFLADPMTGVTLVESGFDAQGNPVAKQSYMTYLGGTSLSTPMFSALWAIANQYAGQPLGNAAHRMYGMKSSAILDIVPPAPIANVSGTITTAGTTTSISEYQLAVPQAPTAFISAFFDTGGSPFIWQVATFGVDTSLFAAKGWDNATGLGVPNGMQFVKAAK